VFSDVSSEGSFSSEQRYEAVVDLELRFIDASFVGGLSRRVREEEAESLKEFRKVELSELGLR